MELALPDLPGAYQKWSSGGFVYIIDTAEKAAGFRRLKTFLTSDVHGTDVEGMVDLTWEIHFFDFNIESPEDVIKYHTM